MSPDEILKDAVNQDRGAEFPILDAVTGMPTGIYATIVGPDSETARKAELAFSDELAAVADAEGKVTAEQRQAARINSLARRIVRLEALEDGKRVPIPANYIHRLLLIPAIHLQIDAYAADRAAHRGNA
jgi:hypothetical protein